jgi:DNA polymerase-1
VAEGDVALAEALVRRAMEGAAELRVPLSVEVGRGPTWAEAH